MHKSKSPLKLFMYLFTEKIKKTGALIVKHQIVQGPRPSSCWCLCPHISCDGNRCLGFPSEPEEGGVLWGYRNYTNACLLACFGSAHTSKRSGSPSLTPLTSGHPCQAVRFLAAQPISGTVRTRGVILGCACTHRRGQFLKSFASRAAGSFALVALSVTLVPHDIGRLLATTKAF